MNLLFDSHREAPFNTMKCSHILLVILLFSSAPHPPSHLANGNETRRLLKKAYDAHETQALGKLIRGIASDAGDLVSALDDPDQEVNLAAQRVIEYSQNPALIAQLEAWRARSGRETGAIARPAIERPTDSVLIYCKKRSLLREIKKRLYPRPGTRATIIGENRQDESVVIRVVEGAFDGNPFTTGYDIVAARRGDRWEIVINTNRWET